MRDVLVNLPEWLGCLEVLGERIDARWNRVLEEAAELATAPEGFTVDGTHLGISAKDLAWAYEHDGVLTADGHVVAGPNADLIGRVAPQGRRARSLAVSHQAREAIDIPVIDTRLTRSLVAQHARHGVRFIRLDGIILHRSVEIAPGATIWPGAMLLGDTRIGPHAEIGAGAWLHDAEVGAGAVIRPYSVLDGASVGQRTQVGPMSHLRGDAQLGDDVRVGNFVEVKKSVFEQGAKASHLAYIGDARVGRAANVGAGTITCNYDGFAKHHTDIGAGVFVGSNSALVAPVTLGDGAIVAAGSVITEDVPADALAIGRARQTLLDARAPQLRERLAAGAKARTATPSPNGEEENA